MHFSRSVTDHLRSITVITLSWIVVAVIFVTFRYFGIDREITGEDASYFLTMGGPVNGDDNIATAPFTLELGRAYFEFILGGLFAGILTGIFEIVVFPKTFRKRSFTTIILTKSLFYAIVLSFAIMVSSFVSLLFLQEPTGNFWSEYWRQLLLFFSSNVFLTLLLLAFIVGLATNFVRQISLRFGPGILWKLIKGDYFSPKEEERIFMFLDVKNSTSIAEQLGHIRFSKFLKDFIYDISDEIYANEGEIYQYIGDEVVITWRSDQPDAKLRCIKCHFDIMQKLMQIAPRYLQNYGIAPKAKSGVHVGKVVITEVGVFKQEIVFHGDTVNTAARIQAECNKYGKTLLLSRDVLNESTLPNGFIAESTGTAILRGKEQPVELFTVRIDEPISA